MKNEHKFIIKLVKDIEDKFSVLAYAYKDGNEPKTHIWWTVCVDNYSLYTSKEYKEFTSQKYAIFKKLNINVIFAYRNTFESILVKLAEADNLIMNISSMKPGTLFIPHETVSAERLLLS